MAGLAAVSGLAAVAGVAALAGLAAVVACSSSVKPTSRPSTPTSTTARVEADGTGLHVRSVGPPGGRVVVLVHGGPGLSMESLVAFDALAGPGRRLVYYDQRGAGGSTKPADGDYRLSAQLGDLDAVRRWAGAETIDLVGQSWGGLVAAGYTASHPEQVRSLVLVDAAPLDWSALLAGERRFADRRRQLQQSGAVPSTVPGDSDDSCLPSLTALLPVYLGDPGGPRPPFHTTCTASTSEATFAALGSAAGQAGMASLASHLGDYHGRALIIMGSKDPFGLAWARREAQLLPGAQVEQLVVAGAGHLPWLEQPQSVVPALDRWLSAGRPR